jgi:hypothetical protein
MLRWLGNLFGMASESARIRVEYDPVYGLPKARVEEWLARNPRLKETYAVQQWLVRNPLLRSEYEAARRRLVLAVGPSGEQMVR